MASIFPRIELKINMQGLHNALRQRIGFSVEPMDLYEVYNTARDPSGQPYWAAVNNGTPVKKSGHVNVKSNSKTVPRKKLMVFAKGGEATYHRVVSGNPAYKMRERTIPLLRGYFKSRIIERKREKLLSRGVPQYGESRDGGPAPIIGMPNERVAYVPDYDRGIRTMPIAGNKMRLINPILHRNPLLQPDFFVSILEDCMDFAIWRLKMYTPTLKPIWYARGYTTEPGTLKNSYQWRRKKGTYEPDSAYARTKGRRTTSSRDPRLGGFVGNFGPMGNTRIGNRGGIYRRQ